MPIKWWFCHCTQLKNRTIVGRWWSADREISLYLPTNATHAHKIVQHLVVSSNKISHCVNSTHHFPIGFRKNFTIHAFSSPNAIQLITHWACLWRMTKGRLARSRLQLQIYPYNCKWNQRKIIIRHQRKMREITLCIISLTYSILTSYSSTNYDPPVRGLIAFHVNKINAQAMHSGLMINSC